MDGIDGLPRLREKMKKVAAAVIAHTSER